MNIFYELARPIMRLLLAALADFSLEGAANVPLQGPLIVASNHLHFADPPLVGAVVPRYVRFMAKQEAFKIPWGFIFTNAYGAFPVRRGQMDRRALRTAESILARGGVVGMFPEGHRSHGRGLQPALDGAGLIARRMGAPILPVAITGTERALNSRPRWPIKVVIGAPFRLEAEEGPLSEATTEIMLHIAELLPPKYRGVYGGEAKEQTTEKIGPAGNEQQVTEEGVAGGEARDLASGIRHRALSSAYCAWERAG